jgi:hypothetical protein
MLINHFRLLLSTLFHVTKRVKVFRALANLLELLNYSMTFYIYCLFSEDFRNTLARTMKWPWFGDKSNAKRNNNVSIHAGALVRTECDKRLAKRDS